MSRKYVILTSIVIVDLVIAVVGGVYVLRSLDRYPTGENLSETVHLQLKTSYPITPKSHMLFLLDNKPLDVFLSVEENTLEEYPFLRCIGREISWECDQGMLDEGGSEDVRRWRPPRSSVTASISVTYSARYTAFPASLFRGETIVESKKSITVISPVSSGRLRRRFIKGSPMGSYVDPFDSDELRNEEITSGWIVEHPSAYETPEYFYKVTEQNNGIFISEHYTLGDFTLDHEWFTLGLPQYIALDYRFVEKLERVQEMMNADGFSITKFKTIYGFRPPSYNMTSIDTDGDKSLKVPLSMHQYGKAVDFIVDENDDLVMDDLDGNGSIDMYDAAMIMHYVNILDREYRSTGKMGYVGGAGLYPHHDFWERPKQSPYIHIDVRGFLDEKGRLIRWPAKWENGETIQWGKM